MEVPQTPHIGPYLWPDASRQLGIPDSPVVHVAIRTVADRLMESQGAECCDQGAAQIAAMRTASRSGLESESFDLATLRFRLAMDLSTDAEQEAGAAESAKTDWLQMAREAILGEGVDPGPDSHKLASRYGWRSATNDNG